MSTEETISNIGTADQNESSTETKPTESTEPSQPTATTTGAQGSSAAVVSQRESDEEARPAGEDFGSLLDKFEQEQSARLRAKKSSRDAALTSAALGALGAAAERLQSAGRSGQESLVPRIVDAVRSRASVGEIAEVLRRCWGAHKPR